MMFTKTKEVFQALPEMWFRLCSARGQAARLQGDKVALELDTDFPFGNDGYCQSKAGFAGGFIGVPESCKRGNSNLRSYGPKISAHGVSIADFAFLNNDVTPAVA